MEIKIDTNFIDKDGLIIFPEIRCPKHPGVVYPIFYQEYAPNWCTDCAGEGISVKDQHKKIGLVYHKVFEGAILNEELWFQCQHWAVQFVTDPIIFERMKIDKEFAEEKWREVREKQKVFYRLKVENLQTNEQNTKEDARPDRRFSARGRRAEKGD